MLHAVFFVYGTKIISRSYKIFECYIKKFSKSDMKTNRGAFIVLEGCDRVGKSTQAEKITKELNKQNIPTVTYAFPNRSTKIGRQINSFLKKENSLSDLMKDRKTLHCLFSKNRWEFEPEMEKLLSEGTTLIVDRYSFSGVAFSVANELDVNWCWEQEKGLPKPDLVLFLRMSLEKAASREDYGNEIYEKLDFQKKVRNEFENMMRLDSSWKVIDVDDKNVDTVSEELLQHILKTVSDVRYRQLSRFH